MASKSSLRDIQRTVEELREELEATERAADRNGNGNTVYVLPERRLRRFSGSDGSSIQTFTEDTRATLKVRGLRDQSAADLVYNYDGRSIKDVNLCMVSAIRASNVYMTLTIFC